MSRPLRPLPDFDPLKTREVAAAFGMSDRHIAHLAQHGQFPGAFQLPSMTGRNGNWRIPYEAAVKVGREMGVLE